MLDELVGPLVFLGWLLAVGIAVVLAAYLFGTGGDGGAPGRRARSWWRRWR